jgi:hypothetical protein
MSAWLQHGSSLSSSTHVGMAAARQQSFIIHIEKERK